MGRRLWAAMLAAVVVGALTARPASAQDRPWTVGAAVGGARLWDDEGTLGPGPAFVGTVGRSVTGRLSAEATLLVASHDRGTPFISWEGEGLALLSRGVFRLRGPTVRVRPFIAGGAGVMRSTGVIIERESHVLPGTVGPIVDRRQWGWTAFAWEAAAGVDIAAGSRAFVQTEFGLTGGEFTRGSQQGVPEPPLWTTRLTVGVGLRF